MEPLNIIKYIRSGLGAGVVNSALHTFPFKQAEEAFHRRIVRTTANCTHTANEIMPLKKALVVSAGELTTPVRMHYDRRGALTLPQRHQYRIRAEWGYGLDVPWTYGLLTPYSSMELAGGGSRALRLGWRFELGQRLSLSLDGERRETAHARPEARPDAARRVAVVGDGEAGDRVARSLDDNDHSTAA